MVLTHKFISLFLSDCYSCRWVLMIFCLYLTVLQIRFFFKPYYISASVLNGNLINVFYWWLARPVNHVSVNCFRLAMKSNFQVFQLSKKSHTQNKLSEVHFSRKICGGFCFPPLIFQWKQLRKFTTDFLVNLVQGGHFSESKKHAWSLFSSWKCNHCAASLFSVKELVLKSFMLSKFEQGEISGQIVTFSDSPPSVTKRMRGGRREKERESQMKWGEVWWFEMLWERKTPYNRDRSIKGEDGIYVCVTFQWPGVSFWL